MIFYNFKINANSLIKPINKEKTANKGGLSFGALRGTRTPDPLLRRQMLYPAELSAQTIKLFTATIIISHKARIIK